MQTKALEHIGRAHLAAGTAVAVFGHHSSASSCREGHSSRNIERVGPVPPRTAGVDHEQIGAVTGQRASQTQHPCHGGQFNTVHAPSTKGGKEGTRLHRGEGLLQPGLHQGRSLRVSEDAAQK